jgi:DNA-binding CsgD family transcriptional regulator
MSNLLDLLQQPLLRLIERMHLPIAVIDASDHVIHVNPAAALAVGIPAERLVGILVEEVVLPEERPRYLEHRRLLGGGRANILRTWLQLPQRDALPVAAIALGLQGARGDWIGQLCALLPDDVAEVEMAARLVRAGALARSLLRAVTAELDARAGGAGEPDSGSDPAAQPAELATLTPQERAIAFRLLHGERTPTIARELRISPNTVRNHLKAIFRKTNTTTQAELVARMMTWQAGRNGSP